ncbi:bifunctional riboflavin kinase/FAD synthetase [Clostridium fallax]|uniref:Riboflavin biosynthesis protein n=1 Tax=Clostridium fallax TaxID=1533 RepID=A0A1M4V3E7_9CLOT|nr:bifunctional riboflavin kinase/FAD synthetase [Clostridium fallax]SHE63496.1 FMN adenylyltransferase /riboflavin kinase [Clostridium fallax]SQB06568.1 riboflavin kinase/FMN adenylyltransferase [Clostridium fallax]
MIVINEDFNKKLDKNTFIALGSFDGIHLGHLSLINKVVSLAKEKDFYSMVFTFKNHPLSLIDKNKVPKLIMNNNYKLDILDSLDVDIACLRTFDKSLMELSPEDFILMLIEKYNMKGVVVGFNYRFGYKNLGDITLLKRLSEKYNFKLVVIDAFKYNSEVVSSTRIREALKDGKVEEAMKMLSKPYMVQGKVVMGRQIGREIGFPTANLELDDRYLIPKIGVYYTNIKWNNEIFKGITSIGHNPTVEGKKLTIETYILNFNKNIYNDELKLYFIERIRDEKKFNSIEDLKIQLIKDKNVAKERKIMINI